MSIIPNLVFPKTSVKMYCMFQATCAAGDVDVPTYLWIPKSRAGFSTSKEICKVFRGKLTSKLSAAQQAIFSSKGVKNLATGGRRAGGSGKYYKWRYGTKGYVTRKNGKKITGGKNQDCIELNVKSKRPRPCSCNKNLPGACYALRPCMTEIGTTTVTFSGSQYLTMFSDNEKCNAASNCVPGHLGYCTTTRNGMAETMSWFGVMPTPFNTLVAIGGVDNADFDPVATLVEWTIYVLGVPIPVPLSLPAVDPETTPLYFLLGCWDGVADFPTVLGTYVEHVPSAADCFP